MVLAQQPASLQNSQTLRSAKTYPDCSESKPRVSVHPPSVARIYGSSSPSKEGISTVVTNHDQMKMLSHP